MLATKRLVKLFLFFFSKDLLIFIARETNHYSSEDWVRPSNVYWKAPNEANDEDNKHDDTVHEEDDEEDGECDGDEYDEDSTPITKKKGLIPCDKNIWIKESATREQKGNRLLLHCNTFLLSLESCWLAAP